MSSSILIPPQELTLSHPAGIRPKVAAVILNLNGENHIQQLLQSLRRINCDSFDLEVIVVDNGSSDGSVQVIRRELKNFGESQLIVNRQNLGASHGRNQALKCVLERTNSTRPDYILTLDNDTKVEPQVIADLVHRAENSKPEEMVFAPLLYFANKPERRQANWWVNGWRLPIQWESELRLRDPYNKGKTVDGVALAAALIKSRCFDELGYFDERLFFGLEDTEWFLRAREKKYEIQIVPVEGKVLHDAHQSLGGADKGVFSSPRVYYVMRNMVLMMTLFSRSHHLGPFYFLKLCMHVARYSMQTLRSMDWLAFKAIWTGLHDGLRRRTGITRNKQFQLRSIPNAQLSRHQSGMKTTAYLYLSSVGISTITLTTLYAFTIDWLNSNLFIACLQTLVIGFLLWAVSEIIVQLLFLVVTRVFLGPLKINSVAMPGGIPSRHRTLLAYMLRSNHYSECEEAFDNMFRSYMDNLDPNGNISAVLVSASTSLSIVQHELNLRDEYRSRIRSTLLSEARVLKRIYINKEALVDDGPRSRFWSCHFHRWLKQGYTLEELDHAIEKLVEGTANHFMYLHRTSTTLKKAGQYQDLMLLGSRGIDRPYTYLTKKYGTLGRSSTTPMFGFQANLQNDQGLPESDLKETICALEQRSIQDMAELRCAGRTYGTKSDISFRYTVLLDSDNRVPPETVHSLIEIAAANPHRGFFQVGLLVFNMETWHAFREILAHRSVSKMPEAMFRALGRFGAYGKGLANNATFIEQFIGTPQTPRETLPIGILSHDTIEALYLNPAYVPNLKFYEGTANNIFSRHAQRVRWALGDLTNAVYLLPNSLGRIIMLIKQLLRKTKEPVSSEGLEMQAISFTARYIAHLSTRSLLQAPLFLLWIMIETFGQSMIIHTNSLLMKAHFYFIFLWLVLLPKIYAPSLLFMSGIQFWIQRDNAGAKRELAASLRQFAGACLEIMTTPFHYMPDILLAPIRLIRSIKSLIKGHAPWKVQAQVDRETRKISFVSSVKRTWYVPLLAFSSAGTLWWFGFETSILFIAMLITWAMFPVTSWLGAKPISSAQRDSTFVRWLLKDFDHRRL